MLDAESSLAKVLKSVERLGLEVRHSISLGDFKFELGAAGSGQETEAYLWAEQMSQPETQEGEDRKVIPFQINAAYVNLVKQYVVALAIRSINGIDVDRKHVVEDVSGKPRSINEYILSIVQSWPSEVVDYSFMEYNKLQIKVGKKYGFTLVHREAMNALEKIVELSGMMQEKIKGQMNETRQDAVPAEEDHGEDDAAEEPVPEPEDHPHQGVLDQGDLG